MYLSATKHLSAVVSLLCNSENCLLFVFRVTLIQGPGKQDKVVPHLLTKKMVKALDELVFNRDEVGILPENIYLFSNQKEGPLNQYQTMQAVASQAGCAEPHRITSNRLRKYISTVVAVVSVINLVF